jgi:NTE family protein
MRPIALLTVAASVLLLVPLPLAHARCVAGQGAPGAPAALVLSGGGAKGAWEAGVAAALIERGVPLRVVAGSSAGALTAAMIADGRLDRLADLWRGVTREQVYFLRPAVVLGGLLPGWLTLVAVDQAGSLLDPGPLRGLVEAALDLERIRRSPTRLVVVTTDLLRRERRLFDNLSVSVDALMAAAAVPGVFPPVEVDGTLLADGGLVGRAPVIEALESGVAVERVVVAVSYAVGEVVERPGTLRRILEEAFETAMVHQIRRDADLARLRHPGVEITLLAPSAPLLLRPLDFGAEGIAGALARGRADGAACVEAWRGR